MTRPLRLLFSRIAGLWQYFSGGNRVSTVFLIGTRTIPNSRVSSTKATKSVATHARKAAGIVVEPRLPASSSRASCPIIVEPQWHPGIVEVTREPSFYWEDKGWQRQGDTYLGHFGTNSRRCPGIIIWDKQGLRDCYISNPPHELWKHPHAPCFCYVGDGKYSVHFSSRPQTVDAAIITVERILKEATRRRS